jgi:hypothetical protein
MLLLPPGLRVTVHALRPGGAPPPCRLFLVQDCSRAVPLCLSLSLFPTHYYARGPPAHSISLPLPAGLRTMPVLPPGKMISVGLVPPSQSLSWNQMGILLKTGVPYYKQHSVFRRDD